MNYKPILASWWLVLFVTSSATADLEILSLVRSPHGVTVSWTNSMPGHAYTLQSATSLGHWSPVATRYGWPIADTRWSIADGLTNRTRWFRITAEPVPAVERGHLVSATLVQALGSQDIQRAIVFNGLGSAQQAHWPLRFYKLIYDTEDAVGLPIRASGALYVPQGPTNSLPLFSYQHGTTLPKTAVPSRGVDDNAAGVLFATSGYISAMPDYVGMGDSPGFHPYLHAKSEATAVVDMLRAARAFCTKNGIQLNEQLFLAGYSQGGHVTMAAHREIEAFYSNEFTVTACAPMAGPYHLSGAENLTDQISASTVLYLVAAYLPIYHLADTLEDLLAPPYGRSLPPLVDGLMDGTHTPAEINKIAPTNGLNVLRGDYLAAFRTDSDQSLRAAVRDNDVYRWTPRAPIHLYHCGGDTMVPYANSVAAYQSFTNKGVCCVTLIDPSAPAALDHGPCWAPSIVAAKNWFETLRQ